MAFHHFSMRRFLSALCLFSACFIAITHPQWVTSIILKRMYLHDPDDFTRFGGVVCVYLWLLFFDTYMIDGLLLECNENQSNANKYLMESASFFICHHAKITNFFFSLFFVYSFLLSCFQPRKFSPQLFLSIFTFNFII